MEDIREKEIVWKAKQTRPHGCALTSNPRESMPLRITTPGVAA